MLTISKTKTVWILLPRMPFFQSQNTECNRYEEMLPVQQVKEMTQRRVHPA